MEGCEAMLGGWAQITGTLFLVIIAGALFLWALRVSYLPGVVAAPVALVFALLVFWPLCLP